MKIGPQKGSSATNETTEEAQKKIITQSTSASVTAQVGKQQVPHGVSSTLMSERETSKSVASNSEQKERFERFSKTANRKTLSVALREWDDLLDKSGVTFLKELNQRGLLGDMLDKLDVQMTLRLAEKDDVFTKFILGDNIRTEEGWFSWFWSMMTNFTLFHKSKQGYLQQRLNALQADTARFEQEISDVAGYIVMIHSGVESPFTDRAAIAGVSKRTNAGSGQLLEEQREAFIKSLSQLIGRYNSFLGDLWSKAYAEEYKKHGVLNLEDWWVAARLAGRSQDVEPEVMEFFKNMNAVDNSKLSASSKSIIHQLIVNYSDPSLALRGAHYVFADDKGMAYARMAELLKPDTYVRGGSFVEEYKKGGLMGALRSNNATSSHYKDEQNDPNMKPTLGVDIPGAGHLMFGLRKKKGSTTGEMETWFQFEAHGYWNLLDYALHKGDFVKHVLSGHAQIGPIGKCRFTEKNGTELNATRPPEKQQVTQ